jgi:hypothetical protein
MKKQRAFAGVNVLLLFMLFMSATWWYNGYKLTQCDFDALYKCEAIHGLGLFAAPASVVTVWFSTDK